jgi:hypothetical protein
MKMKRITVVIPAPLDKKIPIHAIKTIDKEKIAVIVERGSNPSENRNRGIRKSRTEFVAFTNIHSQLSKTWYDEVISFFKAHPKISMVGGPQLTPTDGSNFQKASGHALSSVFGSAVVRNRYNSKKVNMDADETTLTSANLICRKKVFSKVMFDESLYPGEDPKFVEGVREAGFRTAYSPRIIAFNQRRASIKTLARQIYGYGYVRPKKEKLTKTLTRPYFLAPTLFLIYLALLAPLLAISSNMEQLLLTPLYFYIALHAVFLIRIGIDERNILVLLWVPIVFLTIHLAYGWGFLRGLINNILN